MKSKKQRKTSRDTRNLTEFLMTLNEKEFSILYSSQFSCLSVYKSFGEYGKYLIRTMLFTPQKSWSLKEMKSTTISAVKLKKESGQVNETEISNEYLLTIRNLIQMNVLLQNSVGTDQSRVTLKINPLFQRNLVNIIGEDPEIESIDDMGCSIRKLEKYAKKKWEKVLYYIVGNENVRKSVKLTNLLMDAGLVNIDEETSSVSISPEGFQFLLDDIKSQFWKLLQHFLDLQNPKNRIEKINFLFRASFMEIGPAYPFFNLKSDVEKKMVEDLKEFGVFKKKSDAVFYVTPLAKEISDISNESDIKARKRRLLERWKIPGLNGKIIVQTNFKYYLYTDNPIQIATVSLFSNTIFKTPNIVCGLIERASIRMALINGITAEQIINYLEMHAHEKMVNSGEESVPNNVKNQIRLWQEERERLFSQDALLFDNFDDDSIYLGTKKYARKTGDLLWFNDHKKWIVVQNKPGIEERIKKVINILRINKQTF